jgi:hypothetical protein
VTVTAALRFRRAFQAVMDDRGWDTPDIVMEEVHITLKKRFWWRVFLPTVIRDVPGIDKYGIIDASGFSTQQHSPTFPFFRPLAPILDT